MVGDAISVLFSIFCFLQQTTIASMVPFGGFRSIYPIEVNRYPATSSKTRDSLGKTAKCCMYLQTSQQWLSLYTISCMMVYKQTNRKIGEVHWAFGSSQYIVTVMESCPTYESMYERLCCGESQTTN